MYFHKYLDTLCRAKTINNNEWIFGSYILLNQKHYIFYDDSNNIEEKISYEEINIKTLCNFTGIYINHIPLFTSDIVLIEFYLANCTRLYIPTAETDSFIVYKFYNKIIFDEDEYIINSFTSFLGHLNHSTLTNSSIVGNMFDSQNDPEIFAAPLIKL